MCVGGKRKYVVCMLDGKRKYVVCTMGGMCLMKLQGEGQDEELLDWLVCKQDVELAKGEELVLV